MLRRKRILFVLQLVPKKFTWLNSNIETAYNLFADRTKKASPFLYAMYIKHTRF